VNTHMSPTEKPYVAAILLNWNGHNDTAACLDTLMKVSYPNLTVVVVDNASTQPGLDCLKKQFPEAVFIESSTNRGFAGGNNLGIEWAVAKGAEYVLLINNDTVVAPDFLDCMMAQVHQRTGWGAASGTILCHDAGPTNEIWYAGGDMVKYRGEQRRQAVGQEFRPEAAESTPATTGFITGCYMLIPAKLIEKVGVLDEEFFFGTEDLEYCWRLERCGLDLLYVPKSVIWHKGRRSHSFLPDEVYRAYISKVLLLKKMLSPGLFRIWLCAWSAYMMTLAPWRGLRTLRGLGYDKAHPWFYRRAMRDAVRQAWNGRLQTAPGGR
jgi:GT2 family glycosyltransferase